MPPVVRKSPSGRGTVAPSLHSIFILHSRFVLPSASSPSTSTARCSTAHGNIPAENRRAIAAALDRGIEVALVTGRGFTFARPIAERLDLPVVLVASNGAIVRRLDGTTMLRRLMPQAVARDVLAATAGYRGEAAVVFDRPAAGQLVRAGSIGRTRRGPGTTDDTAR